MRPSRIGAHIAKTHYPATPVVVLCTRGAVQGAKVKSHDITHFDGENTDIGVIFQYFVVGQVLKTLCICDIRLLVHEFSGDEALPPAVATPNTAQGNGRRNGVEGNPQADVFHPIDPVIRVVMVPRGGGHCARFFHQYVLVEEPWS